MAATERIVTLPAMTATTTRKSTSAKAAAKAKAPATTKAAARAKAKVTAAKVEASEWHTARADRAAERDAKGETVKARRNETRHPDGAAAVASAGCPQCKAKKGAQCFKANGDDRAPYVHAPRFAAWEAKQA